MAKSMELVTPLGDGVLLFYRMNAREELGRLSEFEIDVLSKRGDINLDDILAKNVTVKLELPERKTRYFNGFVTRFAQTGMHGRYHLYHASVRPWLWFLTRTTNCRIFQELTVPEIIKKVFDQHSIADFKQELTATYPKRTYCVQYRESDFNFVSRLMEEEGIYYYFKQVEGQHTMVLSDSYSAHSTFPDYEQIPFIPMERTARIEQECVNDWDFARVVQPGQYVLDDFDFEKPSVDLEVRAKEQRKYELSDYEIFDSPGAYLKTKDGDHYVRTRLDELQTQFELAHARSNARGVCVGSLFKLTGQQRTDQNREYLITSANYELEYTEYEAIENQGAQYACNFATLSSRQQFRPQRLTPRPFVQGPQTAIVVGPAGDEIYTDKYGRVKLLFHWDRDGQQKRDENCSCWIRVSHPWAGKGWGSVSIPRIGQEVIVDFLEGDPDQPIITGRVYNAESMPPYGLPAGGVVSGIKSNTHKGSGYNEISMDDTAGKEKITIHGQYDMNTTVEHDQTTTVHNNRTDVVNVDDSETVGNNQTQKIGVNQKIDIGGSRTETVGTTESITITAHRTEIVNGGETVTVTGGRSHTVNGTQTTTISIAEMHSVGAGRMHNVGAGEVISVGGAQAVNVGAVQAISVGGAQVVNVGALQKVNVGGPHKLSAAVITETSKGTFNIKAAATCTIEAPTIVLKAGGSKITMDSGGITIKGAKITIKSDGNASMTAGGSIKIKGTNLGED
jgi:type VI secretion system secreted protein VgrG